MKYTCEIPARLPSLNDYIGASRYNRYAGAKLKREADTVISLYVRRMPQFNGPIRIRFTWHEENRKRDPDNVASAKKYILDAMVKTGRIPNDTARYIAGFADDFVYDGTSKVVMEITEEQNNTA